MVRRLALLAIVNTRRLSAATIVGVIYLIWGMLALSIAGCSSPSPSVHEGEIDTPKPSQTTPETRHDPPKSPKYRIKAVVDQGGVPGYVINYGAHQKANPTDIVYVYKDRVLKSKLRLQTVSDRSSIGTLIAGPIVAAPVVGDTITLRERGQGLLGKVVYVDKKHVRVAIDLRWKHGLNRGLSLVVYRLGQRIGTLRVTAVHNWGSWCKPEGNTELTSIIKGDFVEPP